MNNERRKQLESIKSRMAALSDLATDIKGDIESIRDDEQEYFDNMPESLQGGEKGEKSEAAISSLDEVIDALDDFLGCGAEDHLDSATE